jgi:MFS family permease
VWRNRNALLFVSISFVSGFGATAMRLAASLWVLDLTGSPSLAALDGLCVFAPTLAGPFLGAVVDRLPRKALLVVTNLGLAAALVTLLAVGGRADVWLIYAVSVAYGFSYVLLDAGESALLPAALPDEMLARVNGVRMSAQEGTKLIAPLAGAGLYAFAGGKTVALAAAACLLVSAVLYAAIRIGTQHHQERRRFADGWNHLWARHQRPVVLAAVALAMSGFATAASYAVVVDGLHRPATLLGVTAALQGAGSVAGGLVTSRVARLGPIGAAVCAAGFAVKAVPWLPATLASALLVGVGLPWVVVAAYTAIQRGTPPDLLGRVSATATTVIFGPLALAIPLGSAAQAAFGFAPVLLLAAMISGYAAVTAESIRTPFRRAARRTTDL